jgi:hypothetical protein
MFKDRANVVATIVVGVCLAYLALRFLSWGVVHAIWTLPAGVGAAASFDEIEAGADFIGAVDAHEDVPRAVVAEQGDAELFGQLSAAFAGRHSDVGEAVAHALGHGFDEVTGGGAGAEANHPRGWEVLERSARRPSLVPILGHVRVCP